MGFGRIALARAKATLKPAPVPYVRHWNAIRVFIERKKKSESLLPIGRFTTMQSIPTPACSSAKSNIWNERSGIGEVLDSRLSHYRSTKTPPSTGLPCILTRNDESSTYQ